MLRRSKSDLSRALRVRRALRVALGARRFRWRPLDRKGRIPFGSARVVDSLAVAVSRCHDWLCKCRPSSDAWWFSVEQLAFDASGKYSVVVDHNDVLVYRETLWTGYRAPFVVNDRREACCG